MKPPSLKLIITGGPRSGETLVFDHESSIRIGRVVRGNNVVIKDEGISSKHLLIRSELGKWIIEDLDSSNGTAVNSANLVPHTPLDLRDGDTVKLGGYTTILVKMLISVVDESVPRRNPRREVNARVTRNRKNGSCVENSALESGVVEKDGKNIRKGKGRKLNLQEMPPKSANVEGSSRVGDSSLNDELCSDISRSECGVLENQGKFAQKGRGKKRILQGLPPENIEVEVNSRAGGLKNELCAENSGLESKITENVGRITRQGRRRMMNLEEMPQTRTKVAESSKAGELNKKIELCEENSRLEFGAAENEGKPRRRGRPARRNLHKMPPEGNKVEENQKNELCVKSSGLECEATENGGKLGQNDIDLQEMPVEDVQAEEILKSGEKEKEKNVKEGINKVENKVESRFKEPSPELERMTLGEWFDYLEDYLPRKITEETEEMIEDMKKKAERLHHYIIEQKQEKVSCE